MLGYRNGVVCTLGQNFGFDSLWDNTTPSTADRVWYIPVWMPNVCKVTHLYLENGSVVNGNIELGLYDLDGNRLVTTGAVAQAGTTAVQAIALGTAFRVNKGAYYWSFVQSSATGRYQSVTALSGSKARAFGHYIQASTSALPATWTPAFDATIAIPVGGAYLA